jgi:hypothetical protein
MLYHLALRRYSVMLIALCGAVSTMLLFAMNHRSLFAIVDDLLYSCILLSVLLGVWSVVPKTQTAPATKQSNA